MAELAKQAGIGKANQAGDVILQVGIPVQIRAAVAGEIVDGTVIRIIDDTKMIEQPTNNTPPTQGH